MPAGRAALRNNGKWCSCHPLLFGLQQPDGVKGLRLSEGEKVPPQLNESDSNFMEHTSTVKEKRQSTSLADYKIYVKFRRHHLAQSRAEKASRTPDLLERYP